MGDAQTNVPLRVEFVLSRIDIPEEFAKNNDDLLVRISFNDRNKFYFSPRSRACRALDTSAQDIIVDREGSPIRHVVQDNFRLPRNGRFGELTGAASMSVEFKAYPNDDQKTQLCKPAPKTIDVAQYISGAQLNKTSQIEFEVNHEDAKHAITLSFRKRILNSHNDARTDAAKIPGYIAVRCGRFIPADVEAWDESSRDCVVSIEMDEEARKFTFFNTFQNTESDLIVSSNVSSKFHVEAVPDDLTDAKRAAWPRNPIALTYQHCENIASGTTKFNICVFLDSRITAEDTPDGQRPEMEPIDGRPAWKLSKTAFVKNRVLTRTVEIDHEVLHQSIRANGVAQPNFVKLDFAVGGVSLGFIKVGLRAFVSKKQLHDHLLFELVSVAQDRANYVIENVLIDDEEHGRRFGVLRAMLKKWRDCLLRLSRDGAETVGDIPENVDKINGVLEFLSLILMTDLKALAASLAAGHEKDNAFLQLQFLAFIAKTVHKKLDLRVDDATIFPATWADAQYTDRSWNDFMISWQDQAVVSAELVFSTCKTIASVCANIPSPNGVVGGIINIVLGVINMIEMAREVGDVVETLLGKIQTIGDELRAAQKTGASSSRFLAARERVVRKIATDCFKVISAYSMGNRTFGFLTATSVVTNLQALEQKLDAALNHWMNTNISNQIAILSGQVAIALNQSRTIVAAPNQSQSQDQSQDSDETNQL